MSPKASPGRTTIGCQEHSSRTLPGSARDRAPAGDRVHAMWDLTIPITVTIIFTLIGLTLCRRIRKMLVVE